MGGRERRRNKESSLHAEVMQKATELVVHERMAQGEKVTGFKGKKIVPGCSIEEMREKPNIAVEEDTEEMRTWRGLNQEEMDQRWKKLAERMEEEVLEKCKVEDSKREAYSGRGSRLEWGRV